MLMTAMDACGDVCRSEIWRRPSGLVSVVGDRYAPRVLVLIIVMVVWVIVAR